MTDGNNEDLTNAKVVSGEDAHHANESPMEKVGEALKKVSDKVGCKANVVLDNFEKNGEPDRR